MLLALDVGNTNITAGIFVEEKLIDSFRITTKQPRTSDEYGMVLRDIIMQKNIEAKHISAAIISSVVPNIMYSLNNGIKKYFGMTPIVVGPGVKTGINLSRLNPREVGPDKITDIVAAYEIYGGPTLVIDYGTATTYDIVTKDGVFYGGVIAPGIRTSADALCDGAARLPEIEIAMPKTIIGTDTISSMQAGVVYGFIGETKYIIEQMKQQSGFHDMKVVATGGLGRILYEQVPEIDHYDDKLTLKGLRIIYDKQR